MKKISIAAPLLVLGATLAWAEKGVAHIKGTAEGSTISGSVTFEETKEGLKVSANLTGVPAGEHGFHIHEIGSCDDAGKAAGAHFNPLKSNHGFLMKDGMKKAHAGDMGNITAKADGSANLDVILPKKMGLTGGKYNVSGRSVILHEKVDDGSQPAGNAGSRIGCGVIVITGQ